MVHVPFDTRSVNYDEHHFFHHHHDHQSGAGVGGITPTEEQFHYFKGADPYQRGYGGSSGWGRRLQTGAGIGNVLRTLWRILLPVTRKAGTVIGREALATGERILDKVNEGEGLKQAAVAEGRRGIDALLEKGGMQKQFGSGHGVRAAKGIKRRQKRTAAIYVTPSPLHHSSSVIGSIGKAPPPPPSQRTNNNNNNTKRKRARIDTFGLY